MVTSLTKVGGLLTYALAASVALLSGCNDGPTLHTVSGEVSYMGKPVGQGQIVFADANDRGPTAHGPIQQGRYSVETTAGPKQVRITATEETGKTIEGAMGATYPEVVDLIPPKYNSATTLRETVDPGGSLVIDFPLE